MHVRHVSDGDTFIAVRGEAEIKVRMLSIDSPETAHGAPAECGAAEAKRALAELIEGKDVTLVSDPGTDTVDRWERELAYVEINGTDVALTLLQQGRTAAWYPAGEPEPRRYDDYRRAQRVAQDNKVGSWGMCEKLGRP